MKPDDVEYNKDDVGFLAPKSLIGRLRSHVEAHYPLLYLNTPDDAHADRLIGCLRRLCRRAKVLEWNMADGCVDFETKRNVTEYKDLDSALSIWSDFELSSHFLVVKDAHVALRETSAGSTTAFNSLTVSRLKTIAQRILDDDNTVATVFLVSPQPDVPSELEEFSAVFDLPVPDEEEIRRIVDSHAQLYGYSLDTSVLNNLIVALRGFSYRQINLLLNRGFQQDGAVRADDVELVNDEKRQIVKRIGILEIVSVEERWEDIGGLENLKGWLARKAKVMEDLAAARDFGVEVPKGAMIVGMPGCGKSLAAKATATLFGLPLLRLDMGSLMGRYVGDSESNMRRALRLADSISPCVLWVDEVEKAFAGIGGTGHEITNRLFGYFLTWMQEKTTPVFVIATANDVSNLPPELLRKGRFDEVFRVEFPTEAERERILELHLERRKKEPREYHTKDLAKRTEDFSGAELESVVKGAIEHAFVQRAELTNKHLLESVGDTIPLSRVREEDVAKFKRIFDKMGIRNASISSEDGLAKLTELVPLL